MILRCKEEYLLTVQVQGILKINYQYDTSFFENCKIKHVAIFKWPLYSFKFWSSFKINFKKSSLIFLGGRIIVGILTVWLRIFCSSI